MRLSRQLRRAFQAIQARRARNIATRSTVAEDGSLDSRTALRLLRAEGWRPGYTRATVTSADGRTHSVWVPPQRPPLGVRMHGWLSIAPTVALIATVAWVISQLPWWARPIAQVGVGVGVLGHFGLLPNPLRLLGL